MRGSAKPCPMCKRVDTHRASNDICRNCKARVKGLEEIEAEMVGRTTDCTLILIKDRHYALPYISVRAQNEYPMIADGTGHAGRIINALLQELSVYASYPATTTDEDRTSTPALFPKEDFSTHSDYSKWNTLRRMSPDVARTIRELHRITRTALDAEYEQGKRDGQKLLSQLASGDLTLDQFEDKAAGRKR